MTQLMGGENARLSWSSGPLTVYMLCGLQGAGKTTMAAKLANYLAKQGKKPMLAACDIYRPAAINQLQVVGKQVNVPVYEHGTQDPVKTALEAVERARYLGRDVLIIDTAGRLHNKKNLMDELNKMRRVIDREFPEADVRCMLVLDATTGQNGLAQARAFKEVCEIGGIILTKLDGTAKGGIALAIRQELEVPVWYIGVGEGIDDLQPFNAKDFVEALF